MTNTTTVIFPSLVPSSRTYVDGKHPISSTLTMAGLSVRRLIAAYATDPELRLKFNNISDSAAESIFAAYDLAYGNINQVSLPTFITAGVSPELETLIRDEGSTLCWYFLERPSLESTVPGYSTVSVSFIGRLSPSGTTNTETAVTARYWRIINMSANVSPNQYGMVRFAEVGFYYNDVRRIGTYSWNGSFFVGSGDSIYPQNLFDGNLSSWAQIRDPVIPNDSEFRPGFYLKVDLGTPQSVNGMKIAGFSYDSFIASFTLEYSNDDTNWSTLGRSANFAYPGDFTLSPLIRATPLPQTLPTLSVPRPPLQIGVWTANGNAIVDQNYDTGAITQATLLNGGYNNANSVVYSAPIYELYYDDLTITFTTTASSDNTNGNGNGVSFGILDYQTTTPNYVGRSEVYAGLGLENSYLNPHYFAFNYDAFVFPFGSLAGVFIRDTGELYNRNTIRSGYNVSDYQMQGTHTWKIVYKGTNKTKMTAVLYKDNVQVIRVPKLSLPAIGRFAFGGGSSTSTSTATISNLSVQI